MRYCSSCGRKIYEGKYRLKQSIFYYCWKCAKKLRKLGRKKESL